MADATRMGRDTLEDDDVRLAVDEQNEDSGVSIDGSQSRRGRDFNVNKKQRQSRLFDSSPFDRFVFLRERNSWLIFLLFSSRTWFSQEARRFSTRATNLIVQVPALQLRRIAQTSGVHSIRTETQHFVGLFISTD
jgi:hypothetical protein